MLPLIVEPLRNCFLGLRFYLDIVQLSLSKNYIFQFLLISLCEYKKQKKREKKNLIKQIILYWKIFVSKIIEIGERYK